MCVMWYKQNYYKFIVQVIHKDSNKSDKNKVGWLYYSFHWNKSAQYWILEALDFYLYFVSYFQK